MKPLLRSNIYLWATFNIFAGLSAILTTAQLIFGDSVWLLSAHQLSFLAGIFIAYLAGIILTTYKILRHNAVSFYYALVSILVTFGALSIWLLMLKSFYSRPILLITIGLLISLIFFSFAANRYVLKLLIPIIVTLTVTLQLLGNGPAEFLQSVISKDVEPRRTERQIDTSLYSIKATFYDKYICNALDKKCAAPRNGGGISLFGTEYLLATGEGRLYLFSRNAGNDALKTKLLPYQIPINSDEFLNDGHSDELWLFRVTDILVQQTQNSVRLFAAHHYWNDNNKCFVLRVSSLELANYAAISVDQNSKWQTIYEAKPCLPLQKPIEGSHSNRLFSGDESGGRLILLEENKLLLSTGDHLFNGFDRKEMFAQDSTSSYGKTISIDLDNGKTTLYSKGHRNPQGLYKAPNGVIWETEHGPRGGDELNVISKDKNYGWPLVTYGTDYGKRSWPPNPRQGEHNGFQRSTYSWVPSVATSNLIGIEGSLFELWKHDLIVASYSKTLWRVRIREGRVAYVEPIKIRNKNARVRDVLEDNDGRIILWLDSGTIVFLEPKGTVETSQQHQSTPQEIFIAQCGGCHTSSGDSSISIGPSLLKVINRKIGGVAEYQYSAALKSLTGRWTTARLDAFIEDPKEFAPGTLMDFGGISDAEQRLLLIDFLEEANE